ncbi:Ribonuclease Z 1 [Yarrowia sp. C11]|nr:Ribonuclease Z 1 [Yarrowia sp. E02]KAG5369678.1 Ribonuclease Z 1 [Yarrowia sp. C11]
MKAVKKAEDKTKTKARKRAKGELADPFSTQSLYNFMSHSSDTAGPGVTLQTMKGEKFLFGHVTEGTQRAILEQKPRVNKMSGIYLTGPVSWASLSGLAGFLLTLVGMGKTDLDLRSCGNNVNWFCATWRHFVFHKTMSIRTDRMTKGHVTDEINIGGVLIAPTELRQESSADPFSSDYTAESAATVVTETSTLSLSPRNLQPLRKDTPWGNVNKVLKTMFSSPGGDYGYNRKELQKQSETALPAVDLDERSTCYIAQVHPKKGKFNLQAAKALNVPIVNFKDLVAGQNVTLEDGTVVTPEQCVGEPTFYGRILFLDIPDARYIDGVVNCPEWTRKYSSYDAQPVYGAGQKRDSGEMEGEMTASTATENTPEPFVSTVYHFFGPEMESYFANDPEKYFEWMDSLGKNVMHIISAPWLDTHTLTYRGSASLCSKLRNIAGDQFPLHRKDYRTLRDPKADILADKTLQERFHMKLLTKGDSVSIDASTNPSRVVRKDPEEYEGLDYVAEDTDVDRPLRNDDGTLKSRAELLTLGTGSACPSKYRNVAGLIMRVPQADGTFTGVVMDCGEGTYGSLTRMYSAEGCLQIMREIKLVYISHLHADHHLGTPTFIERWLEANPGETLSVVGPQSYKKFLEEMANFTPEMRARISYYGCWSYLDGYRKASTLPEVPGLTSIKTCWAHHCDQAFCVEFGFKLNDEENFSVAYSGDTRPIEAFSQMARNCDLVVHEATLDNSLPEEAVIKKHCTFSEALGVCGDMEAKHVVLTHFSQRYPKLPELSSLTLENKEKEKVPVAIAFDMMRIRLGEIGDQAQHFDAISKALEDGEKSEEQENPEW